MIDYDDQLALNQVKKLQFLITDPDTITPKKYMYQTKAHFIAYLSVGEIHEERAYWPLFNDPQTVADKNPHWEGAHRVDIRSLKWQDYVINTLIPRFLEEGYTGVFLDTLDTVTYLTSLDPVKYAGSEDALVSFMERVRKTYPHLQIYTNNALPLLEKLGPFITGAVAEDVITGYDFNTKSYTDAPQQEEKILLLTSFKEHFNKPVYVILYDSDIHSQRIQKGIRYLKEKGFHYFVSDIHFEKDFLIED